MSYYNTNSETGEQLKNAVRKAQSQDMQIYNYIKERGEFTCWNISDLTGIFITNVRRSMNTLEKDSKVKKVQQVRNHKGAKEWTWEAI